MVTSSSAIITSQKPAVDAHLAAASQHSVAGQHHQDAAADIGNGDFDRAEKHVAAASDHNEKADMATKLAVKVSGKAY